MSLYTIREGQDGHMRVTDAFSGRPVSLPEEVAVISTKTHPPSPNTLPTRSRRLVLGKKLT